MNLTKEIDFEKANLSSKFKYIILLLVFAIFFILSFFQIRDYLDDEYIFRIFQDEFSSNLFLFTEYQYNFWSSRFIIETITIMFYEVPWLWNVLMPLLMSLFCYSIYKIINKDSWIAILVSLSITLIYPSLYSYEVGWITTSLNYIFTLTFLLYVTSVLLQLYRKQRVYWYTYVLVIPALFFASNAEIIAVALIIISVAIIVNLIKANNYKNVLPYIVLLISLSMCIFSLTCPGNHMRYNSELSSFYPNFDNLNIFQKVFNGVFRASSSSIFEPNVCFILLSAFIVILAFSSNCKIYVKAISLVPFICSFFMLITSLIMANNPSVYSYFHTFLMRTRHDPNIFAYWEFYFEIAIFVISMFCICFVILKTMNKNKMSVILLLVLLLGFGTQIGIALSPQIGYLWYRTDAYFAVSMLVVSAVIIMNIYSTKNKASIITATSVLTIFVITMVVFNIISYPVA